MDAAGVDLAEAMAAREPGDGGRVAEGLDQGVKGTPDLATSPSRATRLKIPSTP
jgi:hypothetical protein